MNISLKNVAWFNDMSNNNRLDMTPSFQRNAVWTTKQKSYLIDSILNGYPIPEIYVQEVVDENGSSKCVIVDGQQRMRAVLEFIDNEFCINKKDSPEFNGAKFRDLEPEQKKTLFKYNFVVRTLPELADEEICQIFKRLNQNVVSLNSQELRKAAYSGPLIHIVSDFSEMPLWNRLRIFTANDIKRMRDEEYISELILASIEGVTNKKDRLENFYMETEVEFSKEPYVKETFCKIAETLNPISFDLSYTRWSNKTDFYSLFLSLCKHQDKLPLAGDAQQALLHKLLDISEQVNGCININDDSSELFSKDIMDYAKGVRAASDSTARSLRQIALDNLLIDVFR